MWFQSCNLPQPCAIYATHFPLFDCTESWILGLFTVIYVLKCSILNSSNGTDTQQGEESLFTKELWSTPWEITRIHEKGKSALAIKSLPSNLLQVNIIMQITTVSDLMSEEGWCCRSGDWRWPRFGHWSVHTVIWCCEMTEQEGRDADVITPLGHLHHSKSTFLTMRVRLEDCRARLRG